jgi:hypothetical protein
MIKVSYNKVPISNLGPEMKPDVAFFGLSKRTLAQLHNILNSPMTVSFQILTYSPFLIIFVCYLVHAEDRSNNVYNIDVSG